MQIDLVCSEDVSLRSDVLSVDSLLNKVYYSVSVMLLQFQSGHFSALCGGSGVSGLPLQNCNQSPEAEHISAVEYVKPY